MPYEIAPSANPPVSALVLDSPHSWGDWPSDVATAAPQDIVRTSWDAFVGDLWSSAAHGRAPVLMARFHRSFIDANRARDDIDPELLTDAWPGPLNPTKKSKNGQGLIRRDAVPGIPMYAAKLSAHEVQQRITRYYDPYHAALARLIDAAYLRHGFTCHIDCHSMKSQGNAMNEDNGQDRPDFVVSDLDGATANPALTQYVAQSLTQLGYRVQVNYPYKGAELIRRYSDPTRGRHSVQVEIKRGLYMDERSFKRNAGYAQLEANLHSFTSQLLRELDGTLGAQLRSREAASTPTTA
ncbi:N-formylglutamate deformylase [Acidovorax sp. 100]|uniref:N-formylglutamate amidohydrolase n=1 Tax=Acidovorax sp. 100 TaxID=2135635 RepID=UPI000EF9AF21|nr:N-formylglutamate amidohydrolase [Acidovorax sp. 100]RMA59971.1 N-formylglutamate deformylase [Acidovorax sp. 100]